MSETKVKFRTTRPNTCIIDPVGNKLIFTGRYLILDDPEQIAYVRKELKAFGGTIEEVDLEQQDIVDPVAKIKENAIKEFLAAQAAQAAVDQTSAAPTPPLNPMSTDGLIGVASNAASPARSGATTIKVPK